MYDPCELAKTNTQDGLRLDGVWYSSSAASQRGAVLCLHGAGSNFYAGGLWERLVAPLLNAGYGVLRVNTRGHDGYYATRTAAIGPVRLGAAYELVSDCLLDIAGWLDWLAQRGQQSVVLMGHSLGAIKAIYSQATAADPRIESVIAISPPRLSGSAFRAGPKSHEFLPTLLEAQRSVCEGRPEAILESIFPFPMLITAQAFVDKYGAEKYNIVELSGALKTRTTYIYGELELEHGGVAFSGLPEALLAQRHGQHQLNVEVVSDADHFYIGRYDALAEVVLASLQ